MCKESIEHTADLFSTSMKENIKNKEEWFGKEPADLMDLAYMELIRLNKFVKELDQDSNDFVKEEILEQAMELGSLMLMITDRASSK